MQILTSQSHAQTKPRSPLSEKAAVKEQAASAAVPIDVASVSDQGGAQVADPAQAQRISKFVHEAKESGAHNLRGVMGMMAGQMTGMTVGSLLFAPLAFHYGNVYIATGGAALTGGLMAWLGHKLASREVKEAADSKAVDGGVLAGGLLNAIPKFVYPTVGGATAAEKSIIYGALDRLPLNGVTSVPTIDVVTGLEKAGASGLATPLFSHSRIFLDRDQMALGREWAQEVTTHEVGHTFDFTKGVGPIGTRSWRGGGFGSAPFISDYANTNRMEDYAESYAHYHRAPQELLRTAPDKHAAVQAAQQPGLVEQAIDRPSVRDAGRRIGSAFERAPYLRNALALGASLISPFQIYRGATNLELGLRKGDQKAQLDGKFQLATGSAMFMSGTAPLGLAIGLGHIVTNKLVEDGTISVEQANKVADTSLAVATGPVGFAASSIEGELDKAGLLKGGGTISLFASAPKAARQRNKALANGFTAGAVVGGLLTPFLVGGSAFSMVSSAAGGTWLGGLAGAAVGIGAHMLMAEKSPVRSPFASFAAPGQQEGGLTGDDKKLLAKLIAPTVVGGVGGAVLGGMAGDYLGQALGTAVAGAAGGVTGAAVGRYLGILGGSFALVKGGSKVGAAWAGLGQKARSEEAASKA